MRERNSGKNYKVYQIEKSLLIHSNICFLNAKRFFLFFSFFLFFNFQLSLNTKYLLNGFYVPAMLVTRHIFREVG